MATGLTFLFLLGLPKAITASEFQVNITTLGKQLRPDVASDSSGNFVIVWESARDAGGRPLDVVGRRFDQQGLPFGGEFVVNTTDVSNEVFGGMISAVVDVSESGEFVVAWDSYYYSYDHGTLVRDVLLRRYDDAGIPQGDDFSVSPFAYPDFPYRQTPSVVLDSSGSFLVVWNNYSIVRARGFDGAGAPLTGVLGVNASNATGGLPAVTNNGPEFIVVWGGFFDGSDRGVFGRRIDDMGQLLGTELQANTYTTGPQVAPSVAGNKEGFVVVWQSADQDGDQEGIFGQMFHGGGQPRAEEFQVNTHTLDGQSYADVAVDPDGNFLVTWQSENQDGSGSGIFGQFHDESGIRLGDEFQINISTNGHQFFPAVAATGTGQFVVAWQSMDGSNYGIFGRRIEFCPPAPPGPVTDLAIGLDEAGQNLVFSWTDTPEVETFALFSDDMPDGTFDTVAGSALTGGGGGCGNGLCEPFLAEDCLACPADCNGRDTGSPAERFCCGDGMSETENPVGCEDERCTEDQFECQGSLLTIPVPPGNKFFLLAGANSCDLGPKKQ